ncbi:MAG: bifunctional UDP-N-acetylglucosamine diphosphorylase/glucosamine-1-phosphate N-acetyltransferase GlmU [Gammaproteobacteria bacterium]|nr:bifunctional UDP-N-acetylglucosamine diphosphorylase/glucosamine-1-phosphate N-acetyltransferase GlmU [Gammaproteobacteria bacterium]NNC97864.1 bifunctional UDP-N-acetylglucosamine diphosphorylase/glucosamine-1-phosphate N-acetyltransferase GlmU [Gammaproteobacteria bacterium]NNM12934.1 bifunctional UDP-N-acetylglucosamine diphosphorylase/glucosamine-1-phosphate N-acetyltransferase GlmU [Gammaproteobacteria bacterium]
MNSNLPKVLQPLAGQPLLGHVLDVAKSLGAEIHVVVGHGAQQVQDTFPDSKINWVMQTEQNGTGHAVQVAIPNIENDQDMIVVLYGDVPLIKASTLQGLISQAETCGLAILTVEANDPSGYGRIVRDANAFAERIVEHKDANSQELAIKEINSGILAGRAGLLRECLAKLKNNNAQGEYYLTDVVELANQQGTQVAAVSAETETEVAGVNDKLQLSQVEAAYRQRRAEELLHQGATLADPSRVDVRGNVTVGKDVFIDINVVLKGNIKLDDNVVIGPNCVIIESQVEQDAIIKANSILEYAHVGPRATVGPFARLRPEAFLGSDVRVGNFVEVKKSVLAKGAKVNHLTYIGDAQIGANVNVGAGTVTCNYDGVNKHKTVIKEDSFIGSGTMLVAPVEIGKASTIAAGSVITKDTPAEELTIARVKQKTVPGWKRPEKKDKI